MTPEDQGRMRTRKPGTKEYPSLPSTALVVVDVQQAFDDPAWGVRNNHAAEGNIADLLAFWRRNSGPIVHVRHVNEAPTGRFYQDSAGFLPKPEAQELEGELVVTKTVNSAFIGTDLERHLREGRILDVVLVGLTTDHCVSTTARMAANLGFNTTVISDATATFGRIGPGGRFWLADEIHDSALASLFEEFAAISSTRELKTRFSN